MGEGRQPNTKTPVLTTTAYAIYTNLIEKVETTVKSRDGFPGSRLDI
jgi:hypothetical protein